MYEYKKRKGKFKRLVILFLIMILVSFLSILIYKQYIKLDIYSQSETNSKQSAIRLSNTITEEEKAEEDISNILDKTIKCVVGISKIKNTGSSIFLNNSTQELGLGTGIIVTDNRIYCYKLACCGG